MRASIKNNTMRKIDRLPSMFVDSVAELIKHDPLEISLGLFHGNSKNLYFKCYRKG